MLQHEVAVELNGLDLGQEAVVAIQVRPARLRHADLGLGEMVDDVHEPGGRRDEVGVEDRDELTPRGLESVVERAGFVAVPVGAVDVLDRVPCGAAAGDEGGGDLAGFVGGVVEQLDVELPARVIQFAAGIDQPVDDVLLVEDRKLDGNAGELGEAAGGLAGGILLVPVVEPDELVAMDAVKGEHDHDQEVGDEQEAVEPVPLVEVLEGTIGVVRA